MKLQYGKEHIRRDRERKEQSWIFDEERDLWWLTWKRILWKFPSPPRSLLIIIYQTSILDSSIAIQYVLNAYNFAERDDECSRKFLVMNSHSPPHSPHHLAHTLVLRLLSSTKSSCSTRKRWRKKINYFYFLLCLLSFCFVAFTLISSQHVPPILNA